MAESLKKHMEAINLQHRIARRGLELLVLLVQVRLTNPICATD